MAKLRIWSSGVSVMGSDLKATAQR